DTYFEGIDGRPLHEAKVLLLGQGAVGKTSLLRRLTDGTFDPQEEMTHGIGVRQHKQPLPNGIEIQLNLWDFGGQEIMHNTHQFFLTQRSLYLLLLNARLSTQANRLYYWLTLIRDMTRQNERDSGAPIIIVTNKIDENPGFKLGEGKLRDEFPNILGFVRTNCADPHDVGLQALRSQIATALQSDALRQIYDRLPSNWFDLKQALESLEQPTIPVTHYQALCVEHQLDDPQRQKDYLRVLHELGAILNYQDDPHLADFGIMNRQWVVEGVYAIITSKRLATRHGRLHQNDLPEIYAECDDVKTAAYPRGTHGLILSMMQKFELCYRFATVGNYLVPDLLDEDPPQGLDLMAQKMGALQFRYQYEALPLSILSRFMVREHSKIVKGQLWRKGVVLQRGEQRAIIEADLDASTINIAINGGGNRRVLLEAVRYGFENLHAKRGVTELIPHPSRPKVTFKYNYLLKLAQQGITERYEPDIDGNINPVALLGRIEEPNRRRLPTQQDARHHIVDIEPTPAIHPIPQAPLSLTDDEELTLKQLHHTYRGCKAEAKSYGGLWRVVMFALFFIWVIALTLLSRWVVSRFGWDSLEPITWLIGLPIGFVLWLVKPDQYHPNAVAQRREEVMLAQKLEQYKFDQARYDVLRQKQANAG
ncbi:MAG: COR domain-containing protein, partial [Candidatus Promineifilaceae bacterium]